MNERAGEGTILLYTPAYCKMASHKYVQNVILSTLFTLHTQQEHFSLYSSFSPGGIYGLYTLAK